jgi:hypothetical protein
VSGLFAWHWPSPDRGPPASHSTTKSCHCRPSTTITAHVTRGFHSNKSASAVHACRMHEADKMRPALLNGRPNVAVTLLSRPLPTLSPFLFPPPLIHLPPSSSSSPCPCTSVLQAAHAKRHIPLHTLTHSCRNSVDTYQVLLMRKMQILSASLLLRSLWDGGAKLGKGCLLTIL